jgi:hypothetical protein
MPNLLKYFSHFPSKAKVQMVSSLHASIILKSNCHCGQQNKDQCTEKARATAGNMNCIHGGNGQVALYRRQVGNNKHHARIWFGKYVFVAGCRDKSGNLQNALLSLEIAN